MASGTAYELLEAGGFFAVQEVGGEAGTDEPVFVSVMAQFKFIPGKLLPNNAYPLPTD